MKVKVSLKRLGKPRPVSGRAQAISIGTAFIRLDSFLKLANAVQSGGHAKLVIQEGEVQVNGRICQQRGKKLRPGDTIIFQQIAYEVTES